MNLTILADTSITIVIIFIVVPLVLFLAIFIPLRVIDSNYRAFVLEHSSAIKNLKNINSRYKFKTIPNLDMVHSYDNENFYNDISCRDYLTYQLVYCQKKVLKAIDDTDSNKTIFKQYKSDILKSCTFNQFDSDELPRNINKLKKLEQTMFEERVLNPTTEFDIVVKLTLTDINGNYRRSKKCDFDVNKIDEIVYNLNQKRGSFYLNNQIWNSICRVERGKVTNKMRFSIYSRDGYRCRICGRSGTFHNLEIDHIIPIAKGGKSTYDNLQTLCHRCNVRKGDSMPYGEH